MLGIGGHTLTTDDANALARGKARAAASADWDASVRCAGECHTGEARRDPRRLEYEVADADQHSTSISVMLIVPDGDAATAWYKEALGATELWDLGGVAGLAVDGAPFFLHEANPSNPSEDDPVRVGATSTRIEIFVDDPDAVINRAIAAGATMRSEPEDHQLPWGIHRQGGFNDPFGHHWSVGDRSPLSRHAH